MDTKTTDYISRRDLLARYDAEHAGAPGRARELIEQAPAADVAPVVRARWIRIYENGEPPIEQSLFGVCCRKCMMMPKDKYTKSRYCPNCGAKMDKEGT